MSAAATDIAARARFDYVRYAQLWEDADILLEALAPKPNDVIISIASAGDNALALLATGCERVIAIDLNPTQLACVRMRVACYQTLTHSDFLELMGSRPSQKRAELLSRVARHLSEDDQAFWAGKREEVATRGLGGAGKFENYFRLFRERMLPLVHSRDTIAALLQPKHHEARARFYDESWNSLRWRMMLKVFFSRTVMGRLGRDPAFFDHVEGSLADQVAALTRRALVEQDPSQNPYLRWILTGAHGAALPFASRAENFETIRTRLPHLDLRLGALESLADQGVRADGFNLSDIFEYMSPQAFERAYTTILSMAQSGARLAYWNMMVPRSAPPALAHKVHNLQEKAQRLHAQDKAFFYRAFHIEEVM